MAGSMKKLSEVTVSGTVTEVDLTGISSTYDFYMVKIIGATVDANVGISMRVLNSGTPDTTSNYESAKVRLRADFTGGVNTETGATIVSLTVNTIASTVAGHSFNATIFLRDFANSSAYSTGDLDIIYKSTSGSPTNYIAGLKGSFIHTVNQANNGVRFFTTSNNFDGGRFVLYGIKK